MTPVQLKNECQRLENLILGKGYVRPEVSIFINWSFSGEITIKVEARPSDTALSTTEFFHCPAEAGFENLIKKAEFHISNMKSIRDAKHEAFLRKLALLIDEARENDIDVEMVNPLTEMMTKLSTNILPCS